MEHPLQIEPAKHDVWTLFSDQHYKHRKDIAGAHVYVASLPHHGNTIVGLVAVRPQPGKANSKSSRPHNGHFRESRLVVLRVT